MSCLTLSRVWSYITDELRTTEEIAKHQRDSIAQLERERADLAAASELSREQIVTHQNRIAQLEASLNQKDQQAGEFQQRLWVSIPFEW